LLVGSLALHGLVVYALGLTAASHMPAAGEKDAYLQKVIQKGRARIVAVSVAQKVTMPPPPPDPENVARNALNESLISDVTKLTGNLLDVKLRSELASYVKSNLQDELAAAAKDIADGRLTEDEIRRLHAKFQTRAPGARTTWRSTSSNGPPSAPPNGMRMRYRRRFSATSASSSGPRRDTATTRPARNCGATSTATPCKRATATPPST
jgi:hypothetical protein